MTSDGEAWATNLLLELQHRFGDRLQVAARYAHNRAYDNSSFSCCTSWDGFALEPTAGDPSFIGDPGDEGPGAWGASSAERRHVFVASAIARGPLGLRVNVAQRSPVRIAPDPHRRRRRESWPVPCTRCR
ncbi:MAG: hypothetical protein PVH00_07410 [Gemmatimonadota bacterium]